VNTLFGDQRLLTEVSQYIEAKVNEEIKKSQALVIMVLNTGFTIGDRCLITGSYAKQHYGFSLDKSPADKDLVLIDDEYKPLYELAGSLLPKTCYGGSYGSITIEKENEFHHKPAIASFVWKNEFIEVFSPLEGVTLYSRTNYVPLISLIKCAKEWGRPKDQAFLQELSTTITVQPDPVVLGNIKDGPW
jgi:hypothetical protein